MKIIFEVEKYMSYHPDVIIIDPLYNVRQLLNRYKSYSLIHKNAVLLDSEVFTPSFVEITSNNAEENLNILKKAGVKFPFGKITKILLCLSAIMYMFKKIMLIFFSFSL